MLFSFFDSLRKNMVLAQKIIQENEKYKNVIKKRYNYQKKLSHKSHPPLVRLFLHDIGEGESVMGENGTLGRFFMNNPNSHLCTGRAR